MNYLTFSWGNLETELTSLDQLQIRTIFETPSRKEIAILLPKGASMPDHSAPGEIVVQVLKGQITFSCESQEMHMSALESICVAPYITHSLIATEASIVRLSLSRHDSAARVRSVLFKHQQQ